MKLRVFADAEAVAVAAADYLARRAARAIEERARFRVALAGGSTPRALYRRIAQERHGQLDWARFEIYFSDERALPPSDPASNFRMVEETLLTRVPIPSDQVHRIECERAPAEAAAAYARRLGGDALDLVLLGMGDDGHTASLFPSTPDLWGGGAQVIVTSSPAPPPARVSLSLTAINHARAVAFLVTGENKAERLAEVYSQACSGRPVLPAARVMPSGGELVWFADRAAAARVSAEEGDHAPGR